MLRAMYSNDSLVGKGRLKVGSSRLRAMDSNDVLVGNGVFKVCIRMPKYA